MTGFYNYRNYTHFGYLGSDQQTIGHVMKDAGYQTCVVGKWQLNGLSYDLDGKTDDQRPVHFGFDEYALWQLTKPRSEGERFSNALIEQNGQVLPRDPDVYGPDVFCNYALDFMERHQKKPFFIYYPMVLVHDPFVPTPDTDAWKDPARRYEKDTAYYAEMISYTDKIVGRIEEKLKILGLADNTLLIFTADNGSHPSIVNQTSEGHWQGAKGNTIRTGTHVPLVASWPATMRKGRVYEGLIEFSDFFPTLIELVGQTSKVDGVSFLSILKGDETPTRQTVFVHYDPKWGDRVNQYRNQFVQDKDYKLYQDGTLFHIGRDPLEKTPLKDDQITRPVRDKLAASLSHAPSWHSAPSTTN